ncbi:MAG: AbrB/MazE/SpoVT family DNA-binding domain-containing protein [Oscillospiraceae bacterium]|nr:AbrB/MazE/SpoVT family DNA-binding domain-containing protein [Oscillospiraceae bacterium]
MKATGIVRRIDDLGRVVIPKEIRRTMRIREGDPLEIFTDNDGEVIFKKYSPIGELAGFAGQYAEVLYKVGGCPVVICDRDSVVTVSGVPKKEMLERRVTPMLEDLMDRRAVYSRTGASGEALLFPVEGVDKAALAAAAIISAGDVCGAVVYLSDGREKAGDAEVKLVTAAANFLGKQMEE